MPEFVTPRFMDASVSQADVLAHLRVYGSIRAHLFDLSKNHVYYDDQNILWPTIEGRLFLRRSVYRFCLWVTKVLRPKFKEISYSEACLTNTDLPPYDVLLVLHAFMLHPRAFYADTIRLFPELGVLKGFPLHQVAALIDDSMKYIAKPEQIAFWETATGEHFSMPLTTVPDDEFIITCPSCNHTFKAFWKEASDDGKGSNLAAPCGKCDLVITDLEFGAAIILQDIRRAKSGDGVGLAGTLLTNEGVLDPKHSREVTIKIAKAVGLYDIEGLSVIQVVHRLMEISEHVLGRLSVDFLSLYGFPGGFSFDLSAAVLRQTGFASKMYHNGWTNPKFPERCSAILEESISRYAGFLTLSMDRSAGSLGPAHDIDLVWHTHQLKLNYRTDFLRIFGWFLDHVDFAPVDVLANSYSNGGDRWESTYGTPYHEYFLQARFP